MISPTKRKREVILFMLAVWSVAVCSLLVYAFLPEVVSVSWHLLHGGSVMFEGFRIPVPWGYKEILQREGGIELQQAERWSPLPQYSASDLVIRHFDLPRGSVFDLAKWEEATTKTGIEPAYQFTGANTVQLDGEVGGCVTFSKIERSDWLEIRCMFPAHQLYFSYEGTRPHSESVYRIIASISPVR